MFCNFNSHLTSNCRKLKNYEQGQFNRNSNGSDQNQQYYNLRSNNINNPSFQNNNNFYSSTSRRNFNYFYQYNNRNPQNLPRNNKFTQNFQNNNTLYNPNTHLNYLPPQQIHKIATHTVFYQSNPPNQGSPIQGTKSEKTVRSFPCEQPSNCFYVNTRCSKLIGQTNEPKYRY